MNVKHILTTQFFPQVLTSACKLAYYNNLCALSEVERVTEGWRWMFFCGTSAPLESAAHQGNTFVSERRQNLAEPATCSTLSSHSQSPLRPIRRVGSRSPSGRRLSSVAQDYHRADRKVRQIALFAFADIRVGKCARCQLGKLTLEAYFVRICLVQEVLIRCVPYIFGTGFVFWNMSSRI
jgi:hypothetical protein